MRSPSSISPVSVYIFFLCVWLSLILLLMQLLFTLPVV